MNSQPLEINVGQVAHELEQLAGFSDAPAPAVTRVLFTDTDRAARSFLKKRFADAGLQLREDPIGNIFARWQGSDQQQGAVCTGSHTDAIPHSGRYDGTVGVLGALEAIRSLQRAGFTPRRSIDLLMFTSEEPTRFGLGCLGSRLLSGALPPEIAAELKDRDGQTVEQVRRAAGCDGPLSDIPLSPGEYHAFVELHIEQGPLLEREQIPIGVVTAIAAPAALRVEYHGRGGHAGAVLMPGRADSLLAGAELALAVERAAVSLGGLDTVATTGVLDIHPRAINSIPSRATLEIDVRDIQLARRDRVLDEIKRQAEQIGRTRGQRTAIELLNADPPATCDPAVISAIEAACGDAELPCQLMISRAYHDALFMAMIAPTAMIFIPCRDGVSHRPDEYTSPEQIADGVRVLALTLQRLSEG